MGGDDGDDADFPATAAAAATGDSVSRRRVGGVLLFSSQASQPALMPASQMRTSFAGAFGGGGGGGAISASQVAPRSVSTGRVAALAFSGGGGGGGDEEGTGAGGISGTQQRNKMTRYMPVIQATNANPFLPPRPRASKRPRATQPARRAGGSDPLPEFMRAFQNLASLGAGSFCDVYRVRSRVDGCTYAVKRRKAPLTASHGGVNPDGTARGARALEFREVHALAALAACPHIVRYYHAWCDDDVLYIQTELAWGSLQDAVLGRRPSNAPGGRRLVPPPPEARHSGEGGDDAVGGVGGGDEAAGADAIGAASDLAASRGPPPLSIKKHKTRPRAWLDEDSNGGSGGGGGGDGGEGSVTLALRSRLSGLDSAASQEDAFLTRARPPVSAPRAPLPPSRGRAGTGTAAAGGGDSDTEGGLLRSRRCYSFSDAASPVVGGSETAPGGGGGGGVSPARTTPLVPPELAGGGSTDGGGLLFSSQADGGGGSSRLYRMPSHMPPAACPSVSAGQKRKARQLLLEDALSGGGGAAPTPATSLTAPGAAAAVVPTTSSGDGVALWAGREAAGGEGGSESSAAAAAAAAAAAFLPSPRRRRTGSPSRVVSVAHVPAAPPAPPPLLPRGATSGRSASVIRDASLWMASQSSWDGGGVIGGGAASQGGGLGEDCASQMSAYSVAPHGRSALDGAPVDDPARDGARYHLLEIDVLTVLRHVCLALQYMHARGLAHLDVKPANILVVYDGGPGMCDINGDWLPEVTALGGIASLDLAMVSRVADAAAADAPAPALDLLLAEGSGGGGGGGATGEAREGGDGSVAVSLERLRGLGWVRYKLGDLGQEALISSVEVTEGDSRYLSRELMEGSCENLAAADIFALGLTLYELASGRPLPTGDEEYHSLRDGVLPPEHMPQLSARVQDMLVAMVEQHPGARPTAADILSHPLVAALENPAAYFVNAAGQVVLPTDAAPQPMAAGVPSAAAAGGGSSDVGAPPALDDGSGGERRGHVSDDSYLVTSVTSDVPATLRQPVAASTGVDDEDGVDEDEDDGGVSDGDDLPAWVDAAAFPMLHAVLAGGSGSDGGGGGGSGMSSVESGAGGAPGGALPHVRLADTVLFSLKSSSPGSGSGRFTTAALGARRKRRVRRDSGVGGGGALLSGGLAG